jgi:hypothetical protein
MSTPEVSRSSRCTSSRNFACGRAQLLDHAERDTAAAMHRDAARLVDDDQMVILEQDRKLGGRRVRRNRRLVRLRRADRRHAHEVA